MFAGVTNVRAIRDVNGFAQPGTPGPITLALLGDGIYLVKIQQTTTGQLETTNPITVVEATSWAGDPLSQIFKFDDGCYNSENTGQFLAAGVPGSISMSMSVGANLLPTFAVGTIAPDIVEMQ